MEQVVHVYGKLVPLLLFVFGGYLLDRFLKIDQRTLAAVLVYLLSPMLVCGSVVSAQIGYGDLVLPLLVLGLTNFFAFTSSFLAKKSFDPREASLIAFCAAVPNTGFFGIPLVSALLGEEALVHQVLLAYIGVGITCYTSALFSYRPVSLTCGLRCLRF
jgi:predicted permease